MTFQSNFWETKESKLLLNPRISDEDKKLITQAVLKNSKDSAIWLQSSGTESWQKGAKIVCLEREAILHAAKSVNSFFAVSEKDVWLNPLPLFHIGGLSISARCFLARTKEIILENWSPEAFVEKIIEESVTISSVVPTQVYDLVSKNISCPKSVRILLLGGGSISKELYIGALKLGWPLCPSYGMTETSAMMAGVNQVNFSSTEIPLLKVLNHIQLISWDNKTEVRSLSLFKGFLWVFKNGEFLWDDRPTPFIVDDQLEIKNNLLRVLGRDSELVKILGETVQIKALEDKISSLLESPVAIVAKTINDRRGYDLFLYVESEVEKFNLELLNENLMPFERIKEMKIMSQFPRTVLGKVIKSNF